MKYVTYENKNNPHVTIHQANCREIGKRGGHHKDGRGKYVNHASYHDARTYADSTHYDDIKNCSRCKPLAIPPAVRILPLASAEFEAYGDAHDVQSKYFLDELPFDRGGSYRRKERGLNAVAGTVVLFQYQSSVIASASYVDSQKIERPDDDFKGIINFDVESILTFDPVGAKQLSDCWPEFKSFGNVKQELNPENYHVFRSLLTGMGWPNAWLDANDGDKNDEGEVVSGDGQVRPIVLRHIRERRGQTVFRDALRHRYDGRCLVTGCEVVDVLEAAHIRPLRKMNDHNPENGLLLRADIHTLFDLHLLSIDPDDLKIVTNPCIKDEYGDLAGKTLVCDASKRPSHDSLSVHFRLFQQRLKSN